MKSIERPLRGARNLEQVLKTGLWQSRLLIIVAVAASLMLFLVMLFITTVDAIFLLRYVVVYADPTLSDAARDQLRLQTISRIIGVVDGYLIASAVFLFALGLYKQFAGNIEAAESSEYGNRLLDVNSFDDLKGRLARVIILILIVKFLQQALGLEYSSTLDLLYLGVGVLLIAGAVLFSYWSHKPSKGGA